MTFREATLEDISQIQTVRNSVKENQLSNPALVTDEDCKEYITVRGKGWVCELNNTIIGFSIADLKENNIWALFVHPNYEAKGVGKKLHELMLNWYFNRTQKTVWLSTAPGTRAEEFYKRNGWKVVGTYGKGETKFEMSFPDWKNFPDKK
jgi:GNAT superfamily N-acetyltransferase